jgi:hypothetical protein
MRKIIVVSIIFFAALVNLYSNIARPLQPPDPAGDVLGDALKLDALRIETEELLLDLQGKDTAFSRARYTIRNPLKEIVESDLYFVTPFMDKVTVMINGIVVPLVYEKLTRDKIPWKPESRAVENWRDELGAYRFRATFGAEAETVIIVAFRLPAGYDNTRSDTGIFPAQAAHLLNWGKSGDHVAWYIYNLESANTFKGGIGKLKVEILTPEGAELDTNVALVKEAAESGFFRFTGSFQGIPAPSIEAKVITRTIYNIFGGTFALGLSTNYGDYTEFMAQALFDVFFYNHQFSAGVEGNPFGSGFKIPVLYTFFLGGRQSPSLLSYGDIRFTAGALFNLLPTTAVGFRVAAGLRFLVSVIEISYDFYPFDTIHGYSWRMTFLYKFSI